MEISKSLELFNIKDIELENEDTLKKKYRQLMLKYHPDNCGNDDKAKDVVDAYKLIKELKRKLDTLKICNNALLKSRESLITVVLTLKQLMQIYNGKELKSQTKVINKTNLSKYNILVISEAEILHNNIVTKVTNIQPFEMLGVYEICGDILVQDINNVEHIELKIGNVTRSVDIRNQLIKIRTALDFNIKVDVTITKKKIDKNT